MDEHVINVEADDGAFEVRCSCGELIVFTNYRSLEEINELALAHTNGTS